MAHSSEQSEEPIQQHDFAARPWSKVAVDLCDLDRHTPLVISDYYSNYIEVARVTSITSQSIIKELKAVFMRFGILDVVVTDNGPQFSSAEFSFFSRIWGFDHMTSSPKYPQSNGKAENAVKTVKRLFKKCKDSGQSEFLVLPNWRNTPTEGIGTSPAQCLLGCRCRTLLPIAESLLKLHYETGGDARALAGAKHHQQHYYNRAAKPLKAITPGETVRMKLPGQDTGSPGTCSGKVTNRSYVVKVGDTEYRRNRRHIQRTNELPIPKSEIREADETVPAPLKDSQAKPFDPSNETTATDGNNGLHRPNHTRRAPAWHKDYVVFRN